MFFDVSLPWNAGWLCLFWLRDVSDARVCRGVRGSRRVSRGRSVGGLGWAEGLNSKLLQRVAIKERIQLE